MSSVERAIKLQACSIVNIKLQRVGGFGPALKMHDYCASKGIPVWCGYMPELGISTAGGLHISGLPGYLYPGDLEPSLRWFTDDITTEPISMYQPGYIEVPKGPGLGIGLDMDKVSKYEVWREKFAR
jgi:O-succinylbenzoate synthase